MPVAARTDDGGQGTVAEQLTIRAIWGGMSEEMAATLLKELREDSPEMYRESVNTAASALRMRPDTLRKKPFPQQAATIRRTMTTVALEQAGAHLLIEWLTRRQKPMLQQFLDELGIPHEDGTIKGEHGPEPDLDKLKTAIANLTAQYPEEQVRVYLQAFSVITADDWEHLPDLIP